MRRKWWLRLVPTVALFLFIPTPSSFAATGSRAASVSTCKQGQSLEALGRYDAATTAYLKGLGKTDTASCSQEALARLDSDSRACATAKALDDLDRRKEAESAYRKVLDALPSSTCASAGVKRTDGKDLWTWASTASKDLGNALGALVVGALALSLSGWILLVIGTRIVGIRRLWPFSGLRRVRVRLNSLNDTAVAPTTYGAATTGMLRARLSSAAANARVDQASGSASASDALDGLAEASPQAKIVLAVIGVLKAWLPDRDWVVTGELQATGDQGEGISIAIDNGGAFVDFGVFWRDSAGGPGAPTGAEAYRRLTVPAAGWLAHQVATAQRPSDRLSTDANSWALTQCGLYWADLGDRTSARAFYERALGKDGDNIAALANLGYMDAEEGDVVRGDARLRRAIDLLERL